MQIDDVKSTEQQVVELTENLIAQVNDVVLDEVEDEPKENVPPVEALASEVLSTKEEGKSEEAVVPVEPTDKVAKSNPSSPSSSGTKETSDEPAGGENVVLSEQ